MLTLATSNPAKYAPFARDLERMGLVIEPPAQQFRGDPGRQSPRRRPSLWAARAR